MKKIVVKLVDCVEIEPNARILRKPKRYEECVSIFAKELKNAWISNKKNATDLARAETKLKRRKYSKQYHRSRREKLFKMESTAQSEDKVFRVTTGKPSVHGLDKSVHTERVIVKQSVDGVSSCICVKDERSFKVQVIMTAT